MKPTREEAVRQMSNLSVRSATAWERANNGNLPPARRDHHMALHLGYAEMLEQYVLETFSADVKIDWPGLYPTFSVGDKHFHDCTSLVMHLIPAPTEVSA